MSNAAYVCRDCGIAGAAKTALTRCTNCHSTRLVAHRELDDLNIAHIDCDAFYAAIEKRDDPSLADKPLLIGGGRRGVVSTACYIARMYGCHSAMPMFKALKACPDAVVIKPDFAKYSAVGREVRVLMQRLTPMVEPISIDEAFLDLSGTRLVHNRSPAESCVWLANRIESELGITVSVGLSFNKFLAKMASDLEKPRGFSVVGRGEALEFLSDQPISAMWGVGKSLRAKLEADGIHTIGQVRQTEERVVVERYGSIGRRLWAFARADDRRSVEPGRAAKSVSAETTLNQDLRDADKLAQILWPLCEKVAERLKDKHLAGKTVVLKLKTDRFRLLTRSHTLPAATQLADTLYRSALPMLSAEANGAAFRLVGIGVSELGPDDRADPPDLLDPDIDRRKNVEHAIDAVRAKLGAGAIVKGRGFKSTRPRET
ncbi:MAG: DNA polymerase IV [Pseudomonadota bacterium]